MATAGLLSNEAIEKLRIPAHAGQDSDSMANTVPGSWRTAFRSDGRGTRVAEILAANARRFLAGEPLVTGVDRPREY